MKTLPEMQAEVLEINKALGWHDYLVSFPEAMAMLHSEVSEALEAWRVHGTGDATLTAPTADLHDRRVVGKPEGVGSEFADILIRLLDDCALYGVDLQAEYERKVEFNRSRPYRHGGKRI